MHADTLFIGFISGLVSGFILLLGAWVFLLPRVPAMLKREALRDLTHYGRDAGRHGLGMLLSWLRPGR